MFPDHYGCQFVYKGNSAMKIGILPSKLTIVSTIQTFSYMNIWRPEIVICYVSTNKQFFSAFSVIGTKILRIPEKKKRKKKQEIKNPRKQQTSLTLVVTWHHLVLLASQLSPREKAFYSNIIKTNEASSVLCHKAGTRHNTGGYNSNGIRKMCFGERVDSVVNLLTVYSEWAHGRNQPATPSARQKSED